MKRAKKKTCTLRFPGHGGRCRRVAVDGDMCERHAQAYVAVQNGEADVREIAIELCCARGAPSPGALLTVDEADLLADLYRANERLQSALVALHSRSGRDDEEAR